MPATLAGLRPGERGVVAGFTVLDDFTYRLMQFGILEGTEIEVLRHAPTGDPIEVRVAGGALSLRRAEAERVLVSTPR